MKRIYTCLLFLFFLCLGKGISQSCIVLGCAANYGTQTGDGALPDNTNPASGPGHVFGGCYTDGPFKQVFWQFFFAPISANFTQSYTSTGTSGLDLDYIIYDMGISIPSTSSMTCPIFPVANGWSQDDCNIWPQSDGTTGPGVAAPDGNVFTTVANHYYAIAIVFYQSGVGPFTFTVGDPLLGGSPPDCSNIVLPVRLTDFSAKVNNCTVNLNWDAKSETNSKKYDVESSTDGRNFQTIATINAVNTGADQKYSYQQNNPQQGKLYYRLKMIDIDGKFEYSKIIAMRLNCNRSSVFVYPNPVNNILNVNITNSTDNAITADLYDHQGKLVYKGKMISGTNLINMERFARGIYILKLKGSIQTQIIKVIK